MIRHEIVCDRCGDTSPLTSNQRPTGWNRVESDGQTLDLCPACDAAVQSAIRRAISAAVKAAA